MAEEVEFEISTLNQQGKKSLPYFEDKYVINKTPELNAAVERIVSMCEKNNLVKVIGMSNAHYSEEEGVPKGVAFVTKGPMPALCIVSGYEDLVGGVSIYPVLSFSGQTKPDVSIGEYLQQMKIKKLIYDTSLLQHRNFAGIALGRLNCSVGIYRSKSNSVEEMDDYWNIIVRSYYNKGSADLKRKIEESNLTMAELHASEDYNQLLATSDAIRDAIAAKFAQGIGAKLATDPKSDKILGEKTLLAQSIAVNRYNVVQKLRQGNADFYVFYAGCYGLAEGNINYIAFGLGPSKGYELLGYGGKESTPFGALYYYYAFPMGVSKRLIGADEESRISDPLRKFVHWGGRFLTHEKLEERQYESDFFMQPKRISNICKLGGLRHLPPKLTAIPRGVYITSPSELNAPVSSLLEFDKSKNEIPIAKEHEFIDKYLIKGWRLITRVDPIVKLYDDIITSEDDIYIYFNADRLKQMITLITNNPSADTEQ